MGYDIHYHDDFDGMISAAVMLDFFRSRGDKASQSRINLCFYTGMKLHIAPRGKRLYIVRSVINQKWSKEIACPVPSFALVPGSIAKVATTAK